MLDEEGPVPLAFNPMDRVSALAILKWRYNPPYDLYDVDSNNAEQVVQAFLDPQNAYYSVTDRHGDLLAFCCFGPDAQVPGGNYKAAALDIGLGVRPDLTGQKLGLRYVNAVLAFAHHTFAPTAFRVTVAAFNKRALRVCKKAGFQPVQTFQREQGDRDFVMLVRDA
jgi:ribosomal-protein-alanine N-acetyltransferase